MARSRAVDLSLVAEVFPDGVATRHELLAAGLAGTTITRLCGPGGPWHTVLRGVILLTGQQPSRRQQVRAALAYAGAGAVVTGAEALRRQGVRRTPDLACVQLLVPHACQRSSRDFLALERTRHPPDPLYHDGFPLAPPARALLDAARGAPYLDPVRAMVADAVQRRICSPEAVARELAAYPRSGTPLVRRALEEISAGVRSAAEAWALQLLRRTQLPPAEWNVEVSSAAGRFLAVADAYWPSVGLAWEIDSTEYHLSPADHARGAGRQSRLAAVGVLVVHTLPSRLRRDPAGVCRELQDAFRSAAARPTPAVRWRPWRP